MRPNGLAVIRDEEIKKLGLSMAAAIRRRRESAGLSKNALAQKAGIAVQTVSFIEEGVNSPSLVTLLRICDALDTSLDRMYREALELS